VGLVTHTGEMTTKSWVKNVKGRDNSEYLGLEGKIILR